MFTGPPNLASTVAHFVFPVTRYRYGASTTSTTSGSLGLRTAGSQTSATISLHVTMPTGEQIAALPQGIEPSDARVAYGSADLRTADPDTGARGDEIEWQGERYSVIEIKPYQHGPAGADSYQEYTLRRVRRDDPSPLPTEAAP